MATNKQMQTIIHLYHLSLLLSLLFANIHCSSFEYSSEGVALPDLRDYEQLPTPIFYNEPITLTVVYVKPWSKVVQRQKLARAIYQRREFAVEAPFDGLVGDVYVEYGEKFQVIEPKKVLFDIYRKLKPVEVTKPAIIPDDPFPLNEHAFDDLNFSGPDQQGGMDIAGEYITASDMSLIFISSLSWDVRITRIFIESGQHVTTGQILMNGVRKKDGAKMTIHALHDGEILVVNVKEGQDYKTGHKTYYLRVELPNSIIPFIQDSQESYDGTKQALQ